MKGKNPTAREMRILDDNGYDPEKYLFNKVVSTKEYDIYTFAERNDKKQKITIYHSKGRR